MPIVQHDMLRSLCFEIFKATGIPEEDADNYRYAFGRQPSGRARFSRYVVVARLCTGNEAQIRSVGRARGSSRKSVSAGN